MVDINKLMFTARMGVMGAISLFSVIVFCISAHIIYLTNRAWGTYWDFTALSLATAILSLLTLPVMFLISIKRQGAITSYICVEIAWFWFLWILWVSSAGTATALTWFSGYRGGVVSEFQALQAFCFLNWLALMFYTTTLFIMAIVAHVKGTSAVWTSSVREFDFNTALNKTSTPVGIVPVGGVMMAPQFEQKPGTPSTYYPPQQGVVVPPQGIAPQLTPQQPIQPMYTQPSTPSFTGQPVNYPQAPQVAQV